MDDATAVGEEQMSPARVPRPSSRSRDVDSELAIQAEYCLRKSGYLGLRRVSCDVREGVLVLRGHVSSYYLKQLAQEFARRIEGGETIVNKVEVCGQPSS
jgi:osmotically-inducible protein OsmY